MGSRHLSRANQGQSLVELASRTLDYTWRLAADTLEYAVELVPHLTTDLPQPVGNAIGTALYGTLMLYQDTAETSAPRGTELLDKACDLTLTPLALTTGFCYSLAADLLYSEPLRY